MGAPATALIPWKPFSSQLIKRFLPQYRRFADSQIRRLDSLAAEGGASLFLTANRMTPVEFKRHRDPCAAKESSLFRGLCNVRCDFLQQVRPAHADPRQ